MHPNNTNNGFNLGWARAVLEEAIDRRVIGPSYADLYSGEPGSGELIAARVVNEAWSRLLAHAERPIEPLLAVHNRLRAEDLGPLGVATVSAPDLQAVVDLTQRYMPLLSNVLQLDYVTNGQLFLVRLRNHPLATWPNQLLLLIYRMRLAEQLLRRRPRVELVLLNFEDPGLDADLAELFGAPVLFDASYSGAVIAVDELRRPAPGSQPQIHRAMVELLEDQLERAGGRTVLAVREVLRQMLEAGRPVTAGDVAARLHISQRTLQRRLQDEGSTLAELVRDKRLRLAQRLLLTSGASIQQIADQIGFSSQQAFSRFFKERTGQSPSQYQAEQGATVTPEELLERARRESGGGGASHPA